MRYFLILFMVFFTACTFPQDPENSWKEAKEDALLVGVVDHPPYVVLTDSGPGGTEITKLQEFARRNDLQVEYISGTETELVKKLQEYKIHVVAGGFKKKTIWKKKAGITSTYDKEHVFLIPKGENRLLKQLEDFILKEEKK